ncbi:hypothetical protein SAMN02745938_1134 [Flavobacterium psychrophilum DSM 3660]|nr:hypothetical protein FPSM_02020 [Flavobacterium psychrophilum]SCY27492.1 hypothetical protein SAMN02745938_1134 [Flavobacterium psychrophilum DSM 3660] [Flavobacterium psychrophilum DSM 3660 = ATCC 49418]SNA82079.1 conserved hypothetical protein [Flavobacterium psychrophilum]SNB22591.1 conserved hypothetical protein [Flavobacterium psychrophilum]
MAKKYFKKKNIIPNLLPKNETLNFIFNYSKALRINKIGKETFETILN